MAGLGLGHLRLCEWACAGGGATLEPIIGTPTAGGASVDFRGGTDIWAEYQHSCRGGGSGGSASSSKLCRRAHLVVGFATELHFLVDSPWGGTHSGSFPSGSAPVLPTSHCSLELDLGVSTPTMGEQTLPPTGLCHPQSRGGPAQCPVQALVTTTPNTPPIKGTMASILWGKMWQAFIPKTALAPKILDSRRLSVDNCFS